MPTAEYVASILEAFAGGLNVFKKLGGKRRKKNCARNAGAVEKGSSEEELRKSLINSPREIRRVYERNYSQTGLRERYAAGDATAESSLAGTLLKLNAGLVNIISSFLCGGKQLTQLDYASLTSLSNASCTEAIDTLNQLCQRLSRSQLDLAHAYGRQAAHAAKKDDAKKHHRASTTAKRKSQRPTASTVSGTELRVVPVRSYSAPQLALIRPSTRRTKSTTSSTYSRPKPSNSGATSPPRYTITPPAASPSPVSYQSITPPPSYPQSPSPGETWSYLHPAHALYADPAALAAAHRSRRDVCSIRSDSTRLGEIPMRKWAVPYDAEAMARLNREAMATTWTAEAAGMRAPKKGKLRRLFGG